MLNEMFIQEQVCVLCYGYMGVLLFIDLDYFKNVNDLLGYLVGDSLFIIIVSWLNQVLCFEDMLVRLGGDEFVVLLLELNDDVVQVVMLVCNVVLKIQDSLSEIFEVYGYCLNIGCSIGIVLYLLDQDFIYDIVKQVDVVMYCVKEDGCNVVCLFSKDMY